MARIDSMILFRWNWIAPLALVSCCAVHTSSEWVSGVVHRWQQGSRMFLQTPSTSQAIRVWLAEMSFLTQ